MDTASATTACSAKKKTNRIFPLCYQHRHQGRAIKVMLNFIAFAMSLLRLSNQLLYFIEIQTLIHVTV
jgi:hypothetical protein